MVEVRTHDCEFLLPLALPPDLPPVILMDLDELENRLSVWWIEFGCELLVDANA